MNARQLRLLFFAASMFVVASLFLPIASVSADGPVQGLPWPTTAAWPTAQPLKLGVPLSIGVPSAPVAPAPAPVPLTVGVIPQNVPAGAIYVTPVPSQASAPSAPVVSSQVQSQPVAPPVSAVNTTNSRNDALMPTGTWETLGAGAIVWYLIGTGGPHMEVWLRAEPHLNVTLDIFAPNQSNTPIGRGTPLKSDPTTLNWSGGSWRTSGNWYARVTNHYPAPIRYELTSSAKQMGTKDCYSYWEYIGPDLVYWTRCN